MATMKSKKGNPFEYDVMYSLAKIGYKIARPQSNEENLDIVAFDFSRKIVFLIECKNQKHMTLAKAKKIYKNVILSHAEQIRNNGELYFIALLIFKFQKQTLVAEGLLDLDENKKEYKLIDFRFEFFEDYFGTPMLKRPKGFKLTNLFTENLFYLNNKKEN